VSSSGISFASSALLFRRRNEMKLLSFTAALLALLVSLPSATQAQERVPFAGAAAAGFDVGLFVPGSNELSSSMVLNGTYEFYFTPRISVRAGLGWANPGFSVGAVDSLMQIPLTFDGQYNWEGGKWHPFVGAGIGMHFLRFMSDQSATDNTDTRLGFTVGGGVEYFLNRTVAVKGEGRYHAIEDARGEEPSGTALTIGLKTYF
jgi:outer membrane protein W